MSWFTNVIRREPAPLPPDATREGLLADVIARPDEDEPRWVASDWFIQQGDPRGEYIAVQLTLARLDKDDPRRAELEARDAELLSRHKADWVGRFKGARTEYGVEGERTWAKGNPTFWTFERGFVDTVKMAADDFVTNAAALLTSEPVRRVSLTQARGALSRFVEQCPELERVRELDLGRQTLVDADLDALFGTKRFTSLEGLNLTLCRIGMRRGKRVFTEATARFPRLHTLRLGDNGLGDAGVRALASSPLLETVKCLWLSSNKLGPKGAQALVDSPYTASIEEIHLYGNRLDPEAIAELKGHFEG